MAVKQLSLHFCDAAVPLKEALNYLNDTYILGSAGNFVVLTLIFEPCSSLCLLDCTVGMDDLN